MIENYEYVIGLEIHIKLNSPNKLFCQCANIQEFDNLDPNTHVCPVCTGQPGALPVLNKEPLEKAIILGYALNCHIEGKSSFDRKSYFYPDLPLGFQITQLELPTNREGSVDFFVNNFEDIRHVRIERAHIENDAGKTIHEGTRGIVDYNRAGTPLVEIVTFPDFHNDDEVVEFLKELQRIVRFNGIGYADLEKGQMRVDVNISVREKGSDKLGTKVEVKNMNSFGAIKRAIQHEYERQTDIVMNGGLVSQETRGWDDESGNSYTMRSKEDTLDYRYFPEPDLPVLDLDATYLDRLFEMKVESPFERIKRYKEIYCFNKEYISGLLQTYEINEYFEYVVREGIDPKLAGRWIINNIIRFLNDKGLGIEDLKFSKQQFLDFLRLNESGKLPDAQAKQVITEMFIDGRDAQLIMDEKGFKPVDSGEIDMIVDSVISENEKAFDDFKNGEAKAIGFLVGQVMKKSGGKADPKLVKSLIEAKFTK